MSNKKNNNNDSLQQKQSDEIILSDDLIVSYLHDNPNFFNNNAQLLTSLRLNDSHRGAVSLVERQQNLLREKVTALEEEITQLMVIASQNEQLFVLYSDLYLRLIDCQTANELLDCLYQATTELLSLSELKLWLNQTVKLNHDSLITNDCSDIMHTRLQYDDYYFGRLQQSEQSLLFADVNDGSVVLIKLHHQHQSLGFLAISSKDAEHFDPRMDTLLLSQFRKLVAKLIHQQLFAE